MTSPYETGAIEVAKDVYAFIQAGGSTDAGFIVDRDGVVIIDTLMTASLAYQLMAEIRKVTAAPVRHIINTHWHGDHVFGNAVLPRVPIIAHHTCREDLLAEWDNHREFLRDLYPALWPEMESLEITPPNVTFDTRATIHLAHRSVELLFLGRAHTRGDIVAYLPDVGVAFAGDLAFHKYIPNARDGFPADWIVAASKLEGLRAEVIVPGHGPVGTNIELREMRACLELLVGQIRHSYESGATEEQALQMLELDLFSEWGRQEDRLPGLVQRAYMELRGEL